MPDEDPSPGDLERFGHDTAYCPDCGDEIWDQAEFCPSCGGQVGGRTLTRPPLEGWLQRRWLILVAVAVLVGFVLVWVF